MNALTNQRIAEIFIIAMIVGIGTPMAVLYGYHDGESLAAKAYAITAKTSDSTTTDSSAATDLFQPTLAAIDHGAALFQSDCIACHGEHADGNGVMAPALNPRPVDFTDPNARWKRSREPQDIFKTISEGGPNSAMPAFAVSLSLQERWALVHYIGTLPGVQGHFHPVDADLAKKLALEEKP